MRGWDQIKPADTIYYINPVTGETRIVKNPSLGQELDLYMSGQITNYPSDTIRVLEKNQFIITLGSSSSVGTISLSVISGNHNNDQSTKRNRKR